MRSPFIIVRFIFFSLLLYLNLLTLVFAVWNVSSASSSGISVPGTHVLLIFTTCVGLVLLTLSLVPMVWPKRNFAILTLECAWTATLSLLQIGAAMGSAASITTMIREPTDPSVAVSSVLLLPTTWLLSILQLAYFLTLFVTSLIHSRLDPDIWRSSVYAVKWFGFANSRLKTSDVGIPRPKTGYGNDTWSQHLDDIESSAARKAKHPLPPTEKPAWAPTNARRGVDPPFSPRRDFSPRSSAEDIIPPLKLETKESQKSAGSRFIERFRDSQNISRPPYKQTSFPREIDDHDQPIPLPRLSKWVSAEALRNFTR
ncbi:hypothetical protein V5O48_012960 [Marasmius crinis-equi]|uniref:Uncharacterized protein n=1 Tax=Marasmius crinis-equi TaxID=585013 RepID=A0ABR3F1C2_9AGAR